MTSFNANSVFSFQFIGCAFNQGSEWRLAHCTNPCWLVSEKRMKRMKNYHILLSYLCRNLNGRIVSMTEDWKNPRTTLD